MIVSPDTPAEQVSVDVEKMLGARDIQIEALAQRVATLTEQRNAALAEVARLTEEVAAGAAAS